MSALAVALVMVAVVVSLVGGLVFLVVRANGRPALQPLATATAVAVAPRANPWTWKVWAARGTLIAAVAYLVYWIHNKVSYATPLAYKVCEKHNELYGFGNECPGKDGLAVKVYNITSFALDNWILTLATLILVGTTAYLFFGKKSNAECAGTVSSPAKSATPIAQKDDWKAGNMAELNNYRRFVFVGCWALVLGLVFAGVYYSPEFLGFLHGLQESKIPETMQGKSAMEIAKAAHGAVASGYTFPIMGLMLAGFLATIYVLVPERIEFSVMLASLVFWPIVGLTLHWMWGVNILLIPANMALGTVSIPVWGFWTGAGFIGGLLLLNEKWSALWATGVVLSLSFFLQ